MAARRAALAAAMGAGKSGRGDGGSGGGSGGGSEGASAGLLEPWGFWIGTDATGSPLSVHAHGNQAVHRVLNQRLSFLYMAKAKAAAKGTGILPPAEGPGGYPLLPVLAALAIAGKTL